MSVFTFFHIAARRRQNAKIYTLFLSFKDLSIFAVLSEIT